MCQRLVLLAGLLSWLKPDLRPPRRESHNLERDLPIILLLFSYNILFQYIVLLRIYSTVKLLVPCLSYPLALEGGLCPVQATNVCHLDADYVF